MSRGPDLPSFGWRWFGAVLLVCLLAVGTRAVFLWDVRVDPTYHYLVHDEGVNDKIARAILAGDMPSVSYYKAPLYMYGLAGVYRVFGAEPMRARWVQIFVDSLCPVLILLITRRLFGSLPALLAGVATAVYWCFVFYSVELVDTSLACVFYLLLAWLMVSLPEARWYTWALCGAALGLGAVTRPNVLAFAPVLAMTVVAVGWWRGRRQPAGTPPPGVLRTLGKPVLHAAALTLGCCATILPVTLHNYVVAGDRTLIGTYGGLNFYVANSPWSDGKHGPLIVGEGVPDISAMDRDNIWSRLDLNYNIARTYAQKQLGRTLTMGEVDAYFYDLTKGHIRRHPHKFLADSVKRCCWFFNSYEFPNVKDLYRLCGVSAILNGLSWFHYGVLCPVAVLGVFLAVLARPRADGMVYYVAMLASLFLPGLFFVMNSRYRLPTVYLLVPMAAYGVVRFVRLWREPSRWPTRLGSCAVLLGAGLLGNLDLFDYAADTHHTELRMTYAQACERTERYDLLGEATRRFEDAYFDELNNHHGRPWAAVLHHSAPMTWLFIFHHRLGNTDQAIRYGELMMAQEPFNPPVFLTLFKMLLDTGRRDQARAMLQPAEEHLLETSPELTVECFRLYNRHYQERSVLRRAEKLLISLTRQRPNAGFLRYALDEVRDLLRLTESTTRTGEASSTQPATHKGNDR